MKSKKYLSYYIRLFLLQYLPNEKGLSENTILAYKDALKLLMRYCNDNLKFKIDELPVDRIDDEIIRDFLKHIEQERNSSVRTRNNRLAALKTFFFFLGREVPECLDICRKISSIPQKKFPHKTVDYLDSDELNAILKSIDVNDRNAIRDKALLLFMYNTGARAQEVVNTKINDLRLDAASQVKLIGKGNKERACPLWKETVEAIQKYISIRNPKQENENRLFLNSNGLSITRFGIRYIVKKYSDKAIKLQPSLKKKV